jgi:hypothetical protein
MAAIDASICNPDCYKLNDAIEQARLYMAQSPCFGLELVNFLHFQCLSRSVSLPRVIRGIEILGAIVQEPRLTVLLRPFLASSNSQIVSKCVLVLGRHSQDVGWIKNIMSPGGSGISAPGVSGRIAAKIADGRIRANLIEAIWERRGSDVEQILRQAVSDPYHRVAANAIYGLYLAGSDDYKNALEELIRNSNPAFRRAAVWVMTSAGAPDAALSIKALIKDTDAGVRRAAFAAIVHLRKIAGVKSEAA